ncbi:MBL fold metallo-hydrolase [Hyphomicrobium sp. 99]|uniref:MBL fold metallo-hydrolase n=1 Tax=Hyphomicrobium sp. 99 TaxID=1163419 RepID=UPI0005F893F3|nr:MBL fold metallo-hydrolase [Hyphomicrobium sp. 99]
MTITLRFCGATRTVTGSCFFVRTPKCNFLVDCGLFQGHKTLKELNYRPFPFDPSLIDFVLQTHAHIDHAGLLPKLWKSGFTGPVFMTRGTKDLLSFMLPDSGHIQEMDVENLNRRYAQRGKAQVVPIYTQEDAEACQDNFRTVEYLDWTEVGEGVRVRYWNAGHILGSASIEIEIATGHDDQRLLRLLFSGDIGPEHKLFQPDPDAPANFDYVICESTYGNRKRTRATADERRALLARIVKEALRGDRILLLPLFAVERTQEIIADLTRLQQSGAIPRVPIFLDSPLAIRITKVFQKHAQELEELDIRPSLLTNPNIRFTETADESKAIDRVSGGAILMAASGMCDAGRIRHHLKRWLWTDKATVLLTGYQAQGTLGRLLVDGVEAVIIQGDAVKVRANIVQTDLYSGHADSVELVDWIRRRQPINRALFLIHGEDEEINALRDEIVQGGMPEDRVIAPVLDDELELLANGLGSRPKPVPRRLSPEVVSRADWHNELAQFTLDLREQFERAADDRSRGILMRRLRRALEDKLADSIEEPKNR